MSDEILLDVFNPPQDDMVGHGAALVAMTGSEDFLEDAMQTFTKLRPRQRAQFGATLVYLMLDGHASPSRREVFPTERIPGLHEFQPRAIDALSRVQTTASLLHAKIALLAFSASRTGPPTHLRLAVLTANLTAISARRQLELAWVVNVPLDGSASAEDCADVAAAGDFVAKLLDRRFHCDEREIEPKDRKLTARLDMLLRAATSVAPENRKPRFIHSLDEPLFGQIKKRFPRPTQNPCNLLLCGSGFYEQASIYNQKPRIFELLETLGAFTNHPKRIALVEPEDGGAIGDWASEGETEGWQVVKPTDAMNQNRRLHAKFVYAGHFRDGRFRDGHCYIGSGNLSLRGFLTHGAMANGNIETGVVFAVADRLDAKTIERQLFWRQGESPIEKDDWATGREGDAPEAEPILEASPVLSGRIEASPARRLRLFWRDDLPTQCRANLSWAGRDWFDVDRDGDVALNDEESPSALHVRGGYGREWIVPVVDAAGRVGWRPPRFDKFADALAALLDFPIRPAEATDDEDEEDGEGVDSGGRGNGAAPRPGGGNVIEAEKSYALHAAAELIENVAALQTELPASMLGDWMDHVDRTLRASFPKTLIDTWRTYGIDVFEHLKERELRSPHLIGKQLKQYCEMLDGASRAWRLR